MSFGSSPVLWAGLALGVVWAVREREFGRRVAGPLVAVGVANFLLLEPAEPIWNVAPLLPWFQFPWRILLVEGLAAAVVLALVVDRLEATPRTRAAAPIVALALLLASLPSVVACWTHARAAAIVLMPDQAFATGHPRALATVGMFHPQGIWYAVTTAARNEYLPRAVLAPPTAHPDAAGRIRPPQDLGPPQEQQGAWRRWVADIERPGTYEVAWFNFPGMRATLNGAPLDILVDEDPHGLVRFDLPAGRQVVDVWYERPPQQPLADGVTAVGLMLCLALLAIARRSDGQPT
jgi:hypothetical protein